jgi:tetratricopeptide (TPR) repeat protein
MNPESRREQIKRNPSWKILVLLLLLAAGATYFETTPLRQERSLRQSSLTQLQELAYQEPDNPRVMYHLGLRLEQSGQNEAASAALEKAATHSDSQDIYLAWANAVPPTQAKTILISFLTRHPKSAGAHLALAHIFRQQNDLAPCYEQAFLATQAGDHSLEASQLYGNSALETGRFQEAADAYQRAVTLDPKSAGSRIALGVALMHLNRREEALEAYRQAADLAARDGTSWIALGSAVLQNAASAADLETARKYLSLGMSLRPDLESAYLELGECSLKQKRWKEALTELERVQLYQPDEPEVPFALAQVYRGLGDAERAGKALERHRNLEDYQGERASMLLRADEIDDAHTHLALARLATRYEVYQTAIAEYQKALAQSPHDPVINRELSAVQHQVGEK